jgi:hypothetical protein
LRIGVENAALHHVLYSLLQFEIVFVVASTAGLMAGLTIDVRSLPLAAIVSLAASTAPHL